MTDHTDDRHDRDDDPAEVLRRAIDELDDPARRYEAREALEGLAQAARVRRDCVHDGHVVTRTVTIDDRAIMGDEQ